VGSNAYVIRPMENVAKSELLPGLQRSAALQKVILLINGIILAVIGGLVQRINGWTDVS
jgi:hypothetical protein